MDKNTELPIEQKIAANALEGMRVAFEWGFRCAEKGMNLQAALEQFQKQMGDK